MARTVPAQPDGPNIVRIDNSGPKEVAGDEFVALIRKAAAFADVSARV
jgi:ribose 1,5-bisphosphokinase